MKCYRSERMLNESRISIAPPPRSQRASSTTLPAPPTKLSNQTRQHRPDPPATDTTSQPDETKSDSESSETDSDETTDSSKSDTTDLDDDKASGTDDNEDDLEHSARVFFLSFVNVIFILYC